MHRGNYMFVNKMRLIFAIQKLGTSSVLKYFLLALSIFLIPVGANAAWKEIRTNAGGKTGWVNLVCDSNASGWNSCELDLVIKLTATPNQLVAIGEQSTIEATVTDAYGSPVEAGVKIKWTTTDGTVSAPETLTDANGKTAVTLTSSHSLGGATVTASSADYGGSGSLFVPYIDKWVPYPSAYTSWSNYGAVYSCTAWTPDPSTVATGTWFTQTASCWQTQIQYRQDRVQSVVSGTISDSGAPVALFQAIVVNVSQAAVGTMAVGPTCEYSPGVTEIWDTTDCRGGGGPHYIRVNGVYQNGGAQFINGRTGYMLGGVFYYRGAMMQWTTFSGCAGSEGSLKKYEVCRD
jgi:hypothetical protein